jgi:F420-dependent oxidoreductase-like protein
MKEKILGVGAMGGDAKQVLANIRDLEERGIPAAWLTTGSPNADGLTVLAAAAVQTQDVKLGTCITPTWPRHPVAAVQQAQVLANLAPGRVRLGFGPSHRGTMERVFGVDFSTPLSNLREYVTIVKGLLRDGSMEFEGKHYTTHTALQAPVGDIPVMASALRAGSFEMCGELTDGAISWVSPGVYLRDVALPAMARGAARVGRPVPSLVAHAPICVHDDRQEVLAAAREQLAHYVRQPYYIAMFKEAGFPEAESNNWSDEMIDAVVFSGSEAHVTERIQELYSWGATEIIATVLTAGQDVVGSRQRTLDLLTTVAGQI